MSEHTIGTREEWKAAREELAKLEAEAAERNEEIKQKRLALPWVPVEKEYELDTEDGKKTLAELFDGRSQLLAYNVMFGPDYTLGACPGCTSLADGLDGSLVHLNHRDVTLICFSRAPIDRLIAYKKRMGWEFPYVSTYNSDFAFDFGLALTEEQAQGIPEVKGMIDDPPGWLEEWSRPDRRRPEGRAAREPELDRLRPRERHRLPHLHRVGARPVRRPLLHVPGGADADARAGRPEHLPQGRVPGLTCPSRDSRSSSVGNDESGESHVEGRDNRSNGRKREGSGAISSTSSRPRATTSYRSHAPPVDVITGRGARASPLRGRVRHRLGDPADTGSGRGDGVLHDCEQRGASNGKAKRELGWTPRHPSWREGFPAACSGPGAADRPRPRPAARSPPRAGLTASGGSEFPQPRPGGSE